MQSADGGDCGGASQNRESGQDGANREKGGARGNRPMREAAPPPSARGAAFKFAAHPRLERQRRAAQGQFTQGAIEQPLQGIVGVGRIQSILQAAGANAAGLKEGQHRGAGAVYIGFNLGKRSAELRRDLLVGKLLEVIKDQYETLMLWELAQCAVDQRAPLLGAQVPEQRVRLRRAAFWNR